MREKCTAQRGFTLIELLVVIAIIAILAAILFPAFNAVRENTRRTTCMEKMHQIGTAVKLYREDFQKYPSILCDIPYISDNSAPSGQSVYNGVGTPLDIDQVLISACPLVKLKTIVNGKDSFLCPDNVNPNPTAVTTAVYPPKVPLTGQVKSGAGPVYFYTYDSYDVGPALDANNLASPPFTYEIHYAKDWTGVVGAADPQNQLKYPNPPESTTVITWCTYHAAVNHSNQIPVLRLSGNVKSLPANQFTTKGPLNLGP